MANERITENLTLDLLGVNLNMNNVFAQGDTLNSDIKALLLKAGGKPETEDVYSLSNSASGKGKPEYIITFDEDTNTILIVECKRSIKDHRSQSLNKPRKYAVDGALYYAKYLKEKFNVICLSVSGTTIENLKVSAHEWRKGHTDFLEFSRSKDVILEYKNYLRLFKGEAVQRKFSMDEIRKLALDMHEQLRRVKVTERNKPIFLLEY